MNLPRIYIASRASIPARPELWEKLRREPTLNIISSWHRPENVQPNTDMRAMWDKITEEVLTCDCLVLYVEPNDLPLKGAYVEAGIALAIGKMVYVVHPPVKPEVLRQNLGSWVCHRNVMVCDMIETALYLANRGIDRATYETARR